MPRILPYGEAACREEYVFAITAREPGSIALGPPGQIKITNRISSIEGYLGNFALRLEAKNPGPTLLPRPGKVYRQPTFAETEEVGLVGKIFYEIHPQLWGQGLMSEAFTEVLRFAFEEVGCTAVEVSAEFLHQGQRANHPGGPYKREPGFDQSMHQTWHETYTYKYR
jgi:hypothetical protein